MPAPGVTGLQPAAPLPKHTAGLAGGRAGELRRGAGPAEAIHPAAGPGGKGGPGRGGKGWAPAAGRPLLGRALPSLLKKKQKGHRWRRSGGTGAAAQRRRGGEREGVGVPAALTWPRAPKVIPHPRSAPFLCARGAGSPSSPTPQMGGPGGAPRLPGLFFEGPLTPKQTSHGPGLALERKESSGGICSARPARKLGKLRSRRSRPRGRTRARGGLCPRNLSLHVAALGPSPSVCTPWPPLRRAAEACALCKPGHREDFG